MDINSLTAPAVVVRYTVLGDQAMYILYVRTTSGDYANVNAATYVDAYLEEHLEELCYHSHQEVFI